MRSFDRIKSGIPDLDKSLDNIRLGDNVVWHVSELDEFRLFVKPFINQALKDHRNLIYIRFAYHEPFVDITPEEQEILNHFLFESLCIIHHYLDLFGLKFLVLQV